MFNTLSIRKKFYGFGGLMAAVALIIGAIGYWGIARQGSELDEVVVTSLALRNHLESDMMHDALRADVLGALRAARDNNKEDLAAVKTGCRRSQPEFPRAPCRQQEPAAERRSAGRDRGGRAEAGHLHQDAPSP